MSESNLNVKKLDLTRSQSEITSDRKKNREELIGHLINDSNEGIKAYSSLIPERISLQINEEDRIIIAKMLAKYGFGADDDTLTFLYSKGLKYLFKFHSRGYTEDDIETLNDTIRDGML